jgi:hypothetical protein
MRRVFLVVFIFLTFGLSLQNGFIEVTDDQVNILRHPHDFARIWTAYYEGLYIPVPYTVWTALWRMGAGPFWFHALGLALHAATALLVFEILKRFHPRYAFPAALFWALHYFNVEVVAWASGLRDGLSGFFLFAALLAHLKDRGKTALALGLLAVLSKPGAVVLIPLALILKPSRKIAYFLPLVSFAVFSVAMQKAPDYNWAARAANALGALAFYIVGSPSADHAARAVAAPVVVGLAVLAGAWRSTGLRLYVVALLPVLGLVPFSYQFWSNVADRYAYVPLFGLAFAFASALGYAAPRWPRGTGLAAACVLAALAGASFKYAPRWRDVWALHHGELYRCPPAPAHWWKSGPAAREAEALAESGCQYRIKANSAIILSVYLRRQGLPGLADDYAEEAAYANARTEAALTAMGAY